MANAGSAEEDVRLRSRNPLPTPSLLLAMTSLSLRALIALKLLVLIAFWSFGSARTAVSLPSGALARVHAHNSDSGDLFGAAVALSRDGRVLVVGADLEASRGSDDAGDNALTGAGAAYVFERDGEQWRQRAYLKAPLPAPGVGFGFAVAVSDDGETIAVGAPFEQGAGQGGVHVFRRGDAHWTPVAHLQAPQGVARFGVGIDLSDSGAVLAVAAMGPDARAQAHVFAWRAGRWSADGAVAHSGPGGAEAVPRVALAGHGRLLALVDGAAASVALFEPAGHGWSRARDALIPPAPGHDQALALAFSADGQTLAVAHAQGRIDVHVKTPAAPWALQAHLRAAPHAPALGHRLTLSADGSALAVNAAADAPAVYRFRRQGGRWQAMPALQPTAGGGGLFGSALALSADGRTLAVGSRFETLNRWPWPFAPVPAAGAVHLFSPA